MAYCHVSSVCAYVSCICGKELPASEREAVGSMCTQPDFNQQDLHLIFSFSTTKMQMTKVMGKRTQRKCQRRQVYSTSINRPHTQECTARQRESILFEYLLVENDNFGRITCRMPCVRAWNEIRSSSPHIHNARVLDEATRKQRDARHNIYI